MSQIILGMIEIHSKDIIHRDLSARNVLVHEENSVLTAKITDFGLSRQSNSSDYYKIENKNANFPIAWTAPEVFNSGRIFKQSDVWSFGVLIYEICENGMRKPYRKLTHKEVVEYILEKKILEQPETDCDDALYDVMRLCFTFDYRQRPSFIDLFPKIENLKEKDKDYGRVSEYSQYIDVAIKKLSD